MEEAEMTERREPMAAGLALSSPVTQLQRAGGTKVKMGVL